MRISEQQLIAACEVASSTYGGRTTAADGVATLARQHGMNASSALGFISDYRHLLNGEVFKRTMSAPAMRLFLESIHAEHGTRGLAQALTSLKAHIEYLEGHYKSAKVAMRAIAQEFETLLHEGGSAAEFQEQFELSIARSLLGSREARLQRLSKADKQARSVVVQSTVFVRNPDVVAEALLRASGACERCGREAPFLRAKDGSPYLEVHHKVQLAYGGKDSVDNAIAVCPNCHRRAHYGAADA